MVRGRKRKCRCCKDFFIPDHRACRRQKYCGKNDCRKASKAASQRRWLSKPENRDYFRGAEHVERVRRWRAEHPDRPIKRGPKPRSALQDERVTQIAGSIGESGDLATEALQDVKASQRLVLIGLIANMTDCTLQEEIALTSRRLLRLGQDVVNGVPGYGDKAITVPPASSAGAAPVQLGRSAPHL